MLFTILCYSSPIYLPVHPPSRLLFCLFVSFFFLLVYLLACLLACISWFQAVSCKWNPPTCTPLVLPKVSYPPPPIPHYITSHHITPTPPPHYITSHHITPPHSILLPNPSSMHHLFLSYSPLSLSLPIPTTSSFLSQPLFHSIPNPFFIPSSGYTPGPYSPNPNANYEYSAPQYSAPPSGTYAIPHHELHHFISYHIIDCPINSSHCP